jgi:hypothetical protein
MQTQKLIFTVGMALFLQLGFGQVKGNYDYRSAQNSSISRWQATAQASRLTTLEQLGHKTFTIKGLYNVPADSYMAIFTITQLGKTQKETNALVLAKTDSIKKALTLMGAEVEVFVDMISFIPIYEYEVTRKLFSKDTYNEIPKGFELKKNLHFRYKNAQVLETLVTLCAEQEIYDLVGVDYFIDDIEAKKAELISKAEPLLRKQMARFERLSGIAYNEQHKLVDDGFNLYYPVEQYQSYTAYCSNKLNVVKQAGVVTQIDKTTSQYYRPKMSKGYQFIINPSIIEPVVQIEYELVLKSYPKPEQPAPAPTVTAAKPTVEKKVFLITPDAQIKKLEF